jgi:thioredoxin-related protein
MKRNITALLAVAVLATGAWAGGSGWQKDFDKALKTAKKGDKPLLVEFTEGEASKDLNKKIFFTGKFKSWAKKHKLVLVEIDYSKKVSDKLAKQYADLKAKHKVESFPTVLLLDAQGTSLGALPFTAETKPEEWMAKATDLAEAASGAGGWLTDWEKAKKLSTTTKKPMLVDFTGSDW